MLFEVRNRNLKRNFQWLEVFKYVLVCVCLCVCKGNEDNLLDMTLWLGTQRTRKTRWWTRSFFEN
jgi:hypothetical protein